jgi:hypothetical protein
LAPEFRPPVDVERASHKSHPLPSSRCRRRLVIRIGGRTRGRRRLDQLLMSAAAHGRGALTLIQVNKTTGALTVVKNIHFDATRGVNWPDG